MADFFFYGTLCHAPLLQVVVGRDVPVAPAVAEGFAAYWADGAAYPLLMPLAGGRAEGVLARGLSAAEADRVAFYESGFGCDAQGTAVQVAGGQVTARMFRAVDPVHSGAVWMLSDWVARFGAAAVATAGDFMAQFGVADSGAVAARYGSMMVRGASRVRAGQAAPVSLRFEAGPGDVAVGAARQPYACFFAVEEYDLAFRRFDGTMSPQVTRAVFISGDAVTVLPYDPVRDRVLVIEQFRAGPYARGDGQPWLIEAIAGRIDPGEGPEDCARREAVEEAGLALEALLPVAQYYPSPGGVSEYLYSYVALVDLPDAAAGVFGVEGEAEDIRGHLIGFDDLMALVGSGEVANAPLILTALWLQRERARLRDA